jgi:hypothetical protein
VRRDSTPWTAHRRVTRVRWNDPVGKLVGVRRVRSSRRSRKKTGAILSEEKKREDLNAPPTYG